MAEFCEKLKELRRKADLTQAALAAKSGIPLRTIHQYEQGNREPLLSRAGALADALGVSVESLRGSDAERRIVGAKTNSGKRRKRARAKQ